MQFSFDIKGYTERLDSYTEGKIEYRTECPLSSLTTFKIGGPASLFVTVMSEAELKTALEILTENNIKYFKSSLCRKKYFNRR